MPPDDGEACGLLARAESIAREFALESEDARKVTEHFVEHMRDALQDDSSPSQIPSYVTKVPTGAEKGVFLAVDLGGTNCRVCSVRLHGDGTYALVQEKHAVPRALTVNASHRPLFDFIAERIRDFLRAHPEADVADDDNDNDEGKSMGAAKNDDNDDDDAEAPARKRRQLGFTFSFTYEQHALDRGRILFWDKGWDLPSALGRDPCALLQEAVDALRLPVAVAALANDSVGTLLTRAYTAGGGQKTKTKTPGARTLVGAIFGTGTNAAYVERTRAVARLRGRPAFARPGPDDAMLINTEWGCFGDGRPGLLPTTRWDDRLDAASPHPRREMLEKRVSGLYLGELLRLALADLAAEGALAALALPADSPVFREGGLDSALLSQLAGPDAVAYLARALCMDAAAVSPENVRAVQVIAGAIARRAARLAGVALAAVIIQSDSSRRAAARESLAHATAPSKAHHEPKSTEARRVVSGAGTSPNGKMVSLYRRLRTFVHGLMRSLGLQWMFTPSVPSGDGTGPVDVDVDADADADADDVVEIGVDGSLVEFYPTFEAEMREAIRDVLGPAQERRVRIGMAKDGSGVGAALIALAASMP